MKTFSIRLLAPMLLFCLVPARPCAAAEEPKEEGWVSLFNGKDLSGGRPCMR